MLYRFIARYYNIYHVVVAFTTPLPARSVFSSYISYVVAIKNKKNTIIPYRRRYHRGRWFFLSSPFSICTADTRFRLFVVCFTVFVVNNFTLTAVQIEYIVLFYHDNPRLNTDKFAICNLTALLYYCITLRFVVHYVRYGRRSVSAMLGQWLLRDRCPRSGRVSDFYRNSFGTQ